MFPNKKYFVSIPPPNTQGFFNLLKIFSSEAAIKSTAYGGADFVPIAVPQVCKFYQKIQK